MYRNEDEVIIVIENDGAWYRNTINLLSTQEDLTIFIDKCQLVDTTAWRKLTTEQRAYVVYTLWKGQDKDIRILATRREYKDRSAFAPIWEKLYAKEAVTTQQPTNEKEEITMSTTTQPAFQTKHYVFGVDATTMSNDQLIEAIKKLETEIDNLKQIKTKSTAITSKRSELQNMLDSIVVLLDNR